MIRSKVYCVNEAIMKNRIHQLHMDTFDTNNSLFGDVKVVWAVA